MVSIATYRDQYTQVTDLFLRLISMELEVALIIYDRHRPSVIISSKEGALDCQKKKKAFDVNFLVSWPKPNRLSVRQASVPFTRFTFEYMGRTRLLDKLSGEVGRANRMNEPSSRWPRPDIRKLWRSRNDVHQPNIKAFTHTRQLNMKKMHMNGTMNRNNGQVGSSV